MGDLKRVTEWFLAAAEVEAMSPITVGATAIGDEGRSGGQAGTGCLALAKLIELRRRQCRITAEELARRADVDLEEIISIERAEHGNPEPRTIHQIARVLGLPERGLLELAGLIEARDQRFHQATVRFAARSEPLEDLRPEELAALEEYVKVLAGP